MQFDWQTDEESGDDRTGLGQTVARRFTPASLTGRRRVVGLFVAMALLLATGGWLASRLAGRQIDQATTDRSSELLAVHRTMRAASLTGDVDVFAAFLPEAESFVRTWALDLFRQQLFLDRPSLGLRALAIDPAKRPKVTFSPSLARAEVISWQAYSSNPNPADEPGNEPIWLERLSLYRRSDDRWLLARWPVDEEFWGPWLREEHGLLITEFPALDEEPARRLGQDVGRLVTDLCGRSLNCPVNFRLKLRLLPYSQSLLGLNANYRSQLLTSGYDAFRVNLPTVTLVGRPVDEAGYQALYQGYASWVAAILVQHYGRPRPLDDAATSDYLAAYDLAPPPMPLLPGPLPSEEKEAPPLDWPEQSVGLVCSGFSPARWVIYRPAVDLWDEAGETVGLLPEGEILRLAGETALFPPEGQGSLERRPLNRAGTTVWTTYLWQGAIGHLLQNEDGQQLLLTDPPGRKSPPGKLLFYPFDGGEAPLSLDTAACLSGDCRLTQLAGQAVWSPSGDQFLLTVPNDSPEGIEPGLYHGDGRGGPDRFLGLGFAPHWLDESSFLFIRPSASGTEVVRADELAVVSERARSAVLEVVLDDDLLLAVLPVDERPEGLALSQVLVRVSHPEWWLISATATDRPVDFLFAVRRRTGEIISLGPPVGVRLALPMVSPTGGRYLSVLGFEQGTASGGWTVLVYDLETLPDQPAVHAYEVSTAYYDWSANGGWLLLAEEGVLRLVVPSADYERAVRHGLGCHTVGWM